MKPSYPQIGEGRGIHCPKCGGGLNMRLVAMSYASPSGQFRRRVCDCGADVETSEMVIGLTAEFLDVSALNRDQLRLIRQMVAQFTRENVVVDMPHARLPRLMLADTKRP